MDSLVSGPISLYTASFRLVVEPADVAENVDRAAADPVERKPSVAVVDPIVMDPPVFRVIFRFYRVVADKLKIIVVDFNVGAACFVTGAAVGAKPHAVIRIPNNIAANDDAAGCP